MNNREIFEKVKSHLLSQGKRSMCNLPSCTGELEAVCAYRGDNGTKCAVGCLITDQVYTRSIEGIGVSAGIVVWALKESGIELGTDAIKMLKELQRMHDKLDPSDWSNCLNDIEATFLR